MPHMLDTLNELEAVFKFCEMLEKWRKRGFENLNLSFFLGGFNIIILLKMVKEL